MCVLQAWESDEAIEEDMPESPGAEKQDKEKDQRDSKKNRGETDGDRSQHSVCVLLVSVLKKYSHILLVFLSDEDLHKHGLIRPEENQDEAQEVPDTSAHLSGCPRQGLHQR